MKLVVVKSLPEKKGKYHNLQKIIQEFVNSPHKVVKVELDKGEYKTPESCSESMRVAVKRSKHPVKVRTRGDEVYLEKI